MRLKAFEHFEPKTLTEACLLLREHGSKAAVIAGGTDLVVRMKYGVTTPEALINLKSVEGLGEIRIVDNELHVGALTTLSSLHRSAVIRDQVPVLAEAALAVGAAQLQNMGTIGGNLCLEPRCWYFQQSPSWRQARQDCLKNGGSICYMANGSKRCYALYCGDTAPALLALGAKVRLMHAGGERTLPLEQFFKDDGKNHTDLQPGELLATVIIPLVGSQNGTYLKYRKRGALDFPIVGVAAVIERGEGDVLRVRIAITGAGSQPYLIAIPPDLAGREKPNAEAIERLSEAARSQTKTVSHMEVSPRYRKQLVGVLVKDALNSVLAGADA